MMLMYKNLNVLIWVLEYIISHFIQYVCRSFKCEQSTRQKTLELTLRTNALLVIASLLLFLF